MHASLYAGSVRSVTTGLLTVGLMMAGHVSYAQDQQPHVHGVAELWLVLDGTQLDIEFHSPAMNLLGFEHRAHTDIQRARVLAIQEQLADAELLFKFEPPTCRLIGQTSDLSSVASDGQQGTGADQHETHRHHGEEHFHDHAHDHEQTRHSNLQARYQFECVNPERLKQLRVAIPAAFTGVETLQTQWVINGRQGSAELNQSQYEISFR